jgi:ArsR family transcriptional regulator
MLAHIYVLAYIMAMKLEAIELFKLLADPTRLRCLLLLRSEGELCVCELIYAIAESQPKISRHLAHLRKSGLVVDRKEGLWVHYRLNPALPEWMSAVLAQTLAAMSTRKPYASDLVKLSDMPNRPGGRCCA